MDTYLFARGQVWMFGEDPIISRAKVNRGDRTMAYGHPHLIIQRNGTGRGTVLCVPLTSNPNNLQGGVEFVNAEGETNLIITSNLTCKDTKDIIRYMFTASDELMERVEKKIKYLLAFEDSESTEDSSDNEAIISDDYEEISESVVNSEIDSLPDEVLIETSEETEPASEEKEEVKEKKSYIKWTLEKGSEFVVDYLSMTREEVEEKWGIEDASKTYKYVGRKFPAMEQELRASFGVLKAMRR